MDEKQIEFLIDKKVAEAKLEASEKRVQTISLLAGAALTLFGVILPLLFTFDSSRKIENSIGDMKNEFEKSTKLFKDQLVEINTLQSQNSVQNTNKVNSELLRFENRFRTLSGENFKAPLIELQYQGKLIEGANIAINPKVNFATIEIKNMGESSAKNISIRIYSSLQDLSFSDTEQISWTDFPSDEPAFKYSFGTYQRLPSLDPKESKSFNVQVFENNFIKETYPVLIKVFYEQPEPRIFSFKILTGTN